MSPTPSRIRDGQGMTNEEVAEFLNVHYSTISRLSSGERMPSGSLLMDIIHTFRLDTGEATNAFRLGPSVFSKYFRAHVKDKNPEDFPWLIEDEKPPTA